MCMKTEKARPLSQDEMNAYTTKHQRVIKRIGTVITFAALVLSTTYRISSRALPLIALPLGIVGLVMMDENIDWWKKSVIISGACPNCGHELEVNVAKRSQFRCGHCKHTFFYRPDESVFEIE